MKDQIKKIMHLLHIDSSFALFCNDGKIQVHACAIDINI